MASRIEGPRRVIGINKTTGRVTTELVTSKNLHQGDGGVFRPNEDSNFKARLAEMKKGREGLDNTDNPVRAGKTDPQLEHDLARWNKGSKALDNPGPSVKVGNPHRNRS